MHPEVGHLLPADLQPVVRRRLRSRDPVRLGDGEDRFRRCLERANEVGCPPLLSDPPLNVEPFKVNGLRWSAREGLEENHPTASGVIVERIGVFHGLLEHPVQLADEASGCLATHHAKAGSFTLDASQRAR